MGVLKVVLGIFVPLIVKAAEKRFGSGTGPTKKFPWVQKVVGVLIDQFAEGGVGLPNEAEKASIIQQVVDKLNEAGELKGESTVLALEKPDPDMAEIAALLIQSAGAVLAKARKA